MIKQSEHVNVGKGGLGEVRQEWTVDEAQCSLIGPGQSAALCMIRTSNHRNLKLCPWAFSGHRSMFSPVCVPDSVPKS